uniref:RxLR effector candidate protein n=1 Tax=Hyaloperonospora arabidopsidis (strain Emoy2) TaxID=559515 RepID=M4BH07_HYAAE
MRVFLLALVAAPAFLIRADIPLKAGGPKTKGPHDPSVVPVSTKDHDDDIRPDMLPGDESPEHVITKAFDAFEAAHPGVTLEDAISKRSEMMQLGERFAHTKQLVFESLVSERGEAELAKSLAGLRKSQNEMVKDFVIEYLQVLTNWWATDGKKALDVFNKLEMDKRTFFDLLEGESPSDVVLKAMCECSRRIWWYHEVYGTSE